MPLCCKTKLRAAASTKTARLRPATTGMLTVLIFTPRISWWLAVNGNRSICDKSSKWGRCRCTTSFRLFLRRTAVSPNMVRILRTPSPRTSRKSRNNSGHLPSSVSGEMRYSSVISSATKPLPRVISSSPSSLFPTPLSPVTSTPTPSTSRNTPWRVVDSASALTI